MASLDRFAAPPAELSPPRAGEIHVWSVPLDPPAELVARHRRLLSEDEIARADRFRFDRHRRRYTVGRGVLRTLLGRYLDTDPAAVAFRYGGNDKPYLADRTAIRPAGEPESRRPGSPARGAEAGPAPAGGQALWFNLSNSAELAVVALGTSAEIGVDVEALRPMPDALAIAERFFSAAEREALAAVPAAERDRAFFRCWTRKEAYLKAVGTGITVRLDAFDVTLGPGEPARMLALDGDPEGAAAWRLHHLEPASGYLGALAAPPPPSGGAWRLAGWRWAG